MGCTADAAECGVHIGRLLPRSSIMRRLLSTAKTTLLPAHVHWRVADPLGLNSPEAPSTLIPASSQRVFENYLQNGPRLDDLIKATGGSKLLKMRDPLRT
jgi:hypothetical protein